MKWLIGIGLIFLLAAGAIFLSALNWSHQRIINARYVELKNISGIEREVLDAEKNPALLAVGKLRIIGNIECSLILIDKDICVTAGHCILQAKEKFNFEGEVNPGFSSVIFKTSNGERIEDVSIKRVLKVEGKPDYAIVSLTKEIQNDQIEPLRISNLTMEEMVTREKRLGCAGFNGDSQGDGGMFMTVNRKIKILTETSEKDSIDTNCISFYGGSGGLFFEEKESGEFDFIGVIWGIRDEKYNELGEIVKDELVTTQITPVNAFFNELNKAKKEN